MGSGVWRFSGGDLGIGERSIGGWNVVGWEEGARGLIVRWPGEDKPLNLCG